MAVHLDADPAHHQDGPAARCSGDIVAALLDEVARVRHRVLWDATDSVALLKVRHQGAEHQAPLPQDVLPQGRFPVLLQAAAADRDEAQK
jgi:hypothetical protein